MTPAWVTIIVALISVLGALSAAWLTGRRADRSANAERAARQLEQDQSLKLSLYADLLRAAHALARSVKAGSGPTELAEALEDLHNVASQVELLSPEIASGPLEPVLGLADRLVDLAKRGPATHDVINETLLDYEAAVRTLSSHLHAELVRR